MSCAFEPRERRRERRVADTSRAVDLVTTRRCELTEIDAIPHGAVPLARGLVPLRASTLDGAPPPGDLHFHVAHEGRRLACDGDAVGLGVVERGFDDDGA